MADRTVHSLSPTKLIRLRNRTCAYCGAPFGKALAHTDEHVVGRKFVPKGSLSGVWNLVVLACKVCNDEKCDLENDISVISMIPDIHTSTEHVDPLIATEVGRKAPGAKSRRTGKPVIDSEEKIRLSGQFGRATFTFDFVAPPQVDDNRIAKLARFHVQGFFQQMTFDSSSRTGLFLTGDFHHWFTAKRSNWGDQRLRWFAGHVHDWLPCVRADAANGFFRIHIRRLEGQPVLSWALEWNKGMRVVGFVGNPDAIERVISSCPAVGAGMVHHQGNARMVLREHVALAQDQDKLFGWQGFETHIE